MGYAFEQVCMLHIPQIKKALGISGMLTEASSWMGSDGVEKGQIDLVIEWHGERTDYLCEIKFSENVFAINADYKQSLLDKISAFRESAQHIKSHSILLVMVTTMGVKRNVHSGCVNLEVTLDSLFD